MQNEKLPLSQAANSKLLIWLAFAAVYIIWGSTYLAIRFAIETLPPFSMAGARFLAAGGILALALLIRGKKIPAWRECRSAFFVGVLLLVGGNGCVVWAEQKVPSGITAMIIATTPFWMIFLDRCFGGLKQLKPSVLVAALAGFTGVALLVSPDPKGISNAIPLLPALAILAAAFWWSLGSVLSRRLTLPASPWWTTALQMLGAGVVLSLIGLIRGEPASFDGAAASWVSWASWVYLVVFGSIVGFSAYLWILKHSTPTRVSTYALVNPVVALFLGWSLGGESIGSRILLSAALILPSVFLLLRETGERKSNAKLGLPPAEEPPA